MLKTINFSFPRVDYDILNYKHFTIMRTTPIAPEIPFSYKVFNVEMTGLELGLIKSLLGRTSGTNDDSLKELAFDTFMEMKDISTPYFEISVINLDSTDKKAFKKRLNELNK